MKPKNLDKLLKLLCSPDEANYLLGRQIWRLHNTECTNPKDNVTLRKLLERWGLVSMRRYWKGKKKNGKVRRRRLVLTFEGGITIQIIKYFSKKPLIPSAHSLKLPLYLTHSGHRFSLAAWKNKKNGEKDVIVRNSYELNSVNDCFQYIHTILQKQY